ncbi:MAG: S-formylglutathione hydrolase [Moraxellaceae bacterium]|nr:S-formylglutathione hydrolase [Moraxellaceae bacterium]MDZ4387771.1 S-formylglutathione hydrolase [Moraxellaceae bacterium]
MTVLTTRSSHRCFDGQQIYLEHESTVIGLPMRFSVFLPPVCTGEKPEKRPILFYLAGLTCNEETFMIKAGAQRLAAELGLILVSPDTSPRGANIDGDNSHWDFGVGAGFYLDATQSPWSTHYRMESYITSELLPLVLAQFPADARRVGIFGHSMGGHGAITLALKHPDKFHSVSAFAPIAAPMDCPWGHKAFAGYLGDNRSAWAAHDSCALIAAGKRCPPLLVDQGLADQFLAEQLSTDKLESTCQAAGQSLQLRRHAGYDHGYYFISSFMADHLAHHAKHLV